jgi:hypothetical protein
MAKTKTRTAPRTEIIRVPPARPQTITVRAAAPATKTKTGAKGKHHRGGRGGGGDFMSRVGEPALAGLVLGYIDKSGTNVPTLPGIGRAGTLAIAAWFLRHQLPMAGNLAPGFAAIALYEWQREGKISGIAAQV